MSERREALRRRVYLGARIVHPHLRSDTACLLRNLSGRGARIAVSATVPLPACFELVVDTCGTQRPVEAVWRHGDAIGIRFLDDASGRDRGVPPQAPGSRPECQGPPTGRLLH